MMAGGTSGAARTANPIGVGGASGDQRQYGRFIVFEGGEGVGKSTQAELLAEALAERGIETIRTREPGGTPGAEAIRALLLDPPQGGWDARAEALLFAAARADHVAKRIRPALVDGIWVICDRFLDSSRAYQGSAGGLGDADVLALHTIGSQDLRPDLTIVLQASESEAARRLALRDGGDDDAIGSRSAEYHRAVGEAFTRFAFAEPERYALIAADGSPDAVQQRVWAAVEPLLEGVK